MTDEVKTENQQTTLVSQRGGAGVSARPARAGAGRFGERRHTRKGGGREERVRPEFDQKILMVRRVARVVAGGRRFNFSVALVLGNRKGQVGVGIGKAADTTLAIEKAVRNAKKHLIRIPLTKTNSIPHPVSMKFSSARLMMMPSPNKGLIAGSAVRSVLELGGVKDVNAKILSGSKNKLNIARAAIEALGALTNNQRPRPSAFGGSARPDEPFGRVGQATTDNKKTEKDSSVASGKL